MGTREPARPKVGRSLRSLAVVIPLGRAIFLAPRVVWVDGVENEEERRHSVRVRRGRAILCVCDDDGRSLDVEVQMDMEMRKSMDGEGSAGRR